MQAKTLAGAIFMDDDYLAAFGWAVRHAMEPLAPDNLFITSFSEKPDLLSQWRGYCPPGAGVCIGLDSDALRAFCQVNGYSLNKCIYEEFNQAHHIRSLVDKCFDRFPKPRLSREAYEALPSKEKVDADISYRITTTESATGGAANSALIQLTKEVLEIAPLFKNYGFHEESEWRVIANNPAATKKFRAARSYVVPYIELPVFADAASEILREVIVGPNPNQDRCAVSVRLLLHELRFNNVEVKSSRIPFNSW